MNYREHPGIGGTDARQMVRDFESWAFERRLKLAGQWPSFMEKGPSDAMKFGTMVHMACLEPIKFQQHLVTCPQDINFTTKIGRAWKDAFSEYEKDNPGAFFLKEEQVWAIRHIAASFQKVAPPGIPGITYSVEKEFLGDWKGYLMKGCLDILTDDEVIDVKTTRDISRCVQTIAEER